MIPELHPLQTLNFLRHDLIPNYTMLRCLRVTVLHEGSRSVCNVTIIPTDEQIDLFRSREVFPQSFARWTSSPHEMLSPIPRDAKYRG